MASAGHEPTERSRLLSIRSIRDEEEHSIISSAVTKEEEALGQTAVGEILPYKDYSSIDFLHDLVKDSYRHRAIHASPGLRGSFFASFDAVSGWIAVAVIGAVTGFVAFAIDITEATVSDLKFGHCTTNVLLNREACCRTNDTGRKIESCAAFRSWGNAYGSQFGGYLGWALLFGVISSSITMFSKFVLPSAAPGVGDKQPIQDGDDTIANEVKTPKSMYMAAGAGVPEIKTILSGFVIPNFLGLRVLLLKAIGAVFAVASGLPLGKEAPLIHIGACVANLVGEMFPKYAHNGKQMRELITAGSAAGISAAFGAPIGGVLFAYEELSVYFPRKALYRTFLCSMVAAITLKFFNPFGTGRLVLFETNYGTSYSAVHYLAFILLGVVGGIWGGTFTRCNYMWARWFRKKSIIRDHPIFEVFVVVLIVAAIQFPNPATRARGDEIIRNLLVDCSQKSAESWVCQNEASDSRVKYVLWLLYGTIMQLGTTTITLGIKVPAGIIMPALDGGALFGRLVGQLFAPDISPGIFAMVGAGAFLAGVTRMTISLCVVMFELTGELEYVIPHMVAILCAKWVADALSKESIYDLAQSVLGHPFLSPDEAIEKVAEHEAALAEILIPPASTMLELTVQIPPSNKVPQKLLEEKLNVLKRRGLMDSGLVLVQGGGILQGYIAQSELEFGLQELAQLYPTQTEVRLLGSPTEDGDLDLSRFVNRAPVCICASAPIEVAVAIFAQLGVRYLCITEEGSGKLVGVVIKKRLMSYLDGLKHH